MALKITILSLVHYLSIHVKSMIVLVLKILLECALNFILCSISLTNLLILSHISMNLAHPITNQYIVSIYT